MSPSFTEWDDKYGEHHDLVSLMSYYGATYFGEPHASGRVNRDRKTTTLYETVHTIAGDGWDDKYIVQITEYDTDKYVETLTMIATNDYYGGSYFGQMYAGGRFNKNRKEVTEYEGVTSITADDWVDKYIHFV